MRIVTWNVNGLRAALRKGFPEFVERLAPDVLLLQEVRSTPDQLPPEWAAPQGWNVVWHPAEKLGYAGTAVWSREKIDDVVTGMDAPDPDGRVLRVRTGGVEAVSVYLPSGSSSPERQQVKDAWMPPFAAWSARVKASAPHPVVMGGDFNIAHTPDDIHDPKGNAKNSGFLPHERDWFSELLGSGWRDLLREHVGVRKGPYSWWSNRGQARALDRGWRIDYLLGNAPVSLRAADVLREGGLVVSDHAPVIVDLG